MKDIEDSKMLAKILRQAREQAGLTQAQAAEQCDVGFRTYQRIENCEIIPKLATIVKISSSFQSSILKKFVYYLDGKDSCEENCDSPFGIHQMGFRNSDYATLFSPYEINGIKRILSEGEIKDLATIGYYEINMATEKGYCCPRMMELYHFNQSETLNKEALGKRISSSDLGIYFDSLNILIKYGVPLSLNHNFDYNKENYTIHREARKLPNDSGETIVYGIVYKIEKFD